METIVKQLVVESESFHHEGLIPAEFTCEGENTHFPLRIHNIPPGTLSLALIMDDPDAPKGVFTHWVAWNIPPAAEFKRGSNPGISGSNSYNELGYAGPCPPSGVHRYYLHLYALETELELAEGSSKEELISAMSGHIIGQGEIMGRYQKKRRNSL